jgi:multiple sugar transport system substrate-binding protein
MRESILDAAELGLADIFPAIREGEMKYGGQTFALPLGSPPLMLCRAAPAETIGADATAPTSTPAVVYPSTDAAAAYVLIARALGYTESTRRAEAMFHPETMAPRISDAPWVRALTEIIEQREARRDQPPLNFAEAIKAVFIGQAPATLGWPSLLNQDDDAPAADSITVVEFTPLPTAEQVYSTTRQDWENQLHPQPVTLLGFEGRLVAVTEIGRNAVSAFKLAQWLACGDVAVQLSSRSDATLWYRQSQASAHTRWTGGKQRIAESPPVTEQVAHLLETENPLLIPRIPGIDEYLGALGDAVRTAAPGEAGAQAALEAAAAKWEEITEQLGREEQAGAYRRHLGIEPFP